MYQIVQSTWDPSVLNDKRNPSDQAAPFSERRVLAEVMTMSEARAVLGQSASSGDGYHWEIIALPAAPAPPRPQTLAPDWMQSKLMTEFDPEKWVRVRFVQSGRLTWILKAEAREYWKQKGAGFKAKGLELVDYPNPWDPKPDQGQEGDQEKGDEDLSL